MHHTLDTQTLRFQPLIAPDLGAPDPAPLSEMVEVGNRVSFETTGDDDSAQTLDEARARYAPDPSQLVYRWIVRLDGRAVGRVGVDIPLERDAVEAFGMIALLSEFAGRGIGRRAHRLVEDTARRHSRRVLQAFVDHQPRDGRRLDSPTGFGSVPLDRSARFLQRHGYRLEQVERGSSLDLSADPARWRSLLRQAESAAADYRLLQWWAPIPPEHRAAYGWLKSRMSTDAPSAEMTFSEEAWDEARVCRLEERLRSSDSTMLITAVQHRRTGQLCGFNELVIGSDRSRATQQEDTLVLREHRGHRLGMLLKCAGLLAWRERMPLSPRVRTWNAEENRPMLDINEAIGFRPVIYGGGWGKRLD